MGIIGDAGTRLFSTTISEPGRFISVPNGGEAVDTISVFVTTNEPNERVLLTAMLPTVIHTGPGINYDYNIVYRLYRDNQQIAVTALSETGQAKQRSESSQIIDSAYFRWTDVPGAPRVYNYRITVERSLLGDENISYVGLFNRQIDALVFPQNNN